jgi:hypothetical protein
MIFWKAGRDHIGGALTASTLMKSLAEIALQDEELDLADSLLTNSTFFETLATGLLSECYQMDKAKSHRLLVRVLEAWGRKTLFVLADSSQQMLFMEHSCCQTLLNVNWNGKMALVTPMWKILLGLVFPPMLWSIKFSEDGAVLSTAA